MSLKPYHVRTNYFGREVYSPLAMVEASSDLREFVKHQLGPILQRFKVDFESLEHEYQLILNSLSNLDRVQLSKAERALETKLHGVFSGEEERYDELSNRARIICRQIAPFIQEHGAGGGLKLLDVGCGDGLILHLLTSDPEFKETAQLLDSGEVLLLDIHDYLQPEVHSGPLEYLSLDPNYERFPFAPPKMQNGQLDTKKSNQAGRSFDCILLLTVLHHCNSPRTVFRACWDVASPGALFLVIESVIDPNPEDSSSSPSTLTAHRSLDSSSKDRLNAFLNLSPAEQMVYVGFMDWFYNRVLHKDVQVPFNFTTPAEWNEFFELFDGVEVLATHLEGFDQKSVPEYHTLHILRKQS